MEKGVAAGKAEAFVDEARLWARHVEMARFGGTPLGGVNRQALTAEEIDARRCLIGWARDIGFTVSMDGMGNLFIRKAGIDDSLPPVLTGSHIDTQPSGGRFDGIYGILAGLEALQAIDAAGIATLRPIEVVTWMNEEGSRFSPGCMGSLGFVDPTRTPELQAIRDLSGTTVAQALEGLRGAFKNVPSRPLGFVPAAFVETHIEQGPRLESARKTIGVVTGIQGTRRFHVEVHGENAHAGTTPRRRRKDALLAAAHIVGGLERLMRDPADVVRFTIGRFIVSPGAPSVVPGHVMFTIDFRHPDDAVLQARGDEVEAVCRKYAGKCDVTVKQISRTKPVEFVGRVAEAIEQATQRLRLPHMRMPSGAGHDAQNLVKICPTGMIFVPCERGISHNEAENANPSDLAAGARVLAETLVDLASH
jgi:N-carbamoyl-L-amino-acid hydrolase